MTDRDERIREIAYFLWLEEGAPEGEADRHWLAAEALVASEPSKMSPSKSRLRRAQENAPSVTGRRDRTYLEPIFGSDVREQWPSPF